MHFTTFCAVPEWRFYLGLRKYSWTSLKRFLDALLGPGNFVNGVNTVTISKWKYPAKSLVINKFARSYQLTLGIMHHANKLLQEFATAVVHTYNESFSRLTSMTGIHQEAKALFLRLTKQYILSRDWHPTLWRKMPDTSFLPYHPTSPHHHHHHLAGIPRPISPNA